jgi:uncharacterized protein (DUF169 family)
MNNFQELKDSLSLESDPIGVKLIYENHYHFKEDLLFKEAYRSDGYCEYVKRASQGEFLKIRKGDFSCHTGNISLGFQKSNSLELTIKLDSKGLKFIYLFPINKFVPENYDSIILILKPSNCMNLIQAYVRLYNKPLKITCGAINGICSEVTAHVIKRNEVNFSFLCPNSRKNGLFNDCELLCGIPVKMANELIEEIISLRNLEKNNNFLNQNNR